MKFKGLFERALLNRNGTYVISFITSDGHAAEELQKIDVAEFQTVEVSKFREKRSLNANAYFHVLCDKIAKETSQGAEETKRRLVLDYGTPYSDENGEKVYVRLPKSVDVSNIYAYAKWIGESKDTKKPCADYLLYKPTHTLNTAEMAHLIDQTIEEAKTLDIEPMTPNQIAEMMSRWENEG